MQVDGQLRHGAVDLQRELLQVARHAHRPGAVAEVALDLAEDRRDGVAGERDLALEVEAVDRLDEAQRGDLQEVVERLLRALVAARELARERQEALDERLAVDRVAAVAGSARTAPGPPAPGSAREPGRTWARARPSQPRPASRGVRRAAAGGRLGGGWSSRRVVDPCRCGHGRAAERRRRPTPPPMVSPAGMKRVAATGTIADAHDTQGERQVISILIAVLLAALVYALCLALGLPAIVGIVAAILVLVSGIGTGGYGFGRRGTRSRHRTGREQRPGGDAGRPGGARPGAARGTTGQRELYDGAAALTYYAMLVAVPGGPGRGQPARARRRRRASSPTRPTTSSTAAPTRRPPTPSSGALEQVIEASPGALGVTLVVLRRPGAQRRVGRLRARPAARSTGSTPSRSTAASCGASSSDVGDDARRPAALRRRPRGGLPRRRDRRGHRGCDRPGRHGAADVWRIARWPLALAAAALAYAIVYAYAPAIEPPRWRWISPGAAFGVAAVAAGVGRLRALPPELLELRRRVRRGRRGDRAAAVALPLRQRVPARRAVRRRARP